MEMIKNTILKAYITQISNQDTDYLICFPKDNIYLIFINLA
jgi:hypothetical protein